MKRLLLFIVALVMSSLSFAQLTGTKNIPGNYATLASAISDLNTQGVGAGGVVLNLLAGNPETAPAGGYQITTLTGTSSNTIVIQGNGNTITASGALTVGALNDAIFAIVGADYVTIQGFVMQENAANTVTALATNNMTEFGVALFYATVTDGAKNITIQNNTISLNRTYANTFGIYSNVMHSATAVTTTAGITAVTGANDNTKIYSNNISNVNNGIVIVGSTTAAYMNTGIDIGGSAAGTANIISNYGLTGTFSAYPSVITSYVMGIYVNNCLGTNVSYNSITCPGLNTAGSVCGVFMQASGTLPVVGGPWNNTINHNDVAVKSGYASGGIYGLYITEANLVINNDANYNNFHDFGHTVTGSGSIYCMYMAAPGMVLNIKNNTFTAISVNTTSSFYFIYGNATLPVGGVQTCDNNSIVTSFTKTGGGGTVYGYYNYASSPATVTDYLTNNNFSNIFLTGATTFYGAYFQDGGAAVKVASGNTLSNITGGTSAIYGLMVTYGTANIFNNTISNITSAVTSSIYCISAGNSSTTTQNIYSNKITGISSTGAAAIYGIYTAASSAPALSNIYQNEICSLSGSAAGSLVYGIYTSAGTTTNIYNNLVGNLYASAATGLNAVNGIYLTATSAYKVYYNTVYLDATSSSATTFGTSCVYFSSSATSLDMIDNILVNLSTPAQEGSNVGTNGISACLRRSGGTTGTIPANYLATSDRNDFWCKPASGTNNHLTYVEGTSTITNPYNTFAAYKVWIASRDQLSFAENPTFISTGCNDAGYLHINATVATQIESGGIPVTVNSVVVGVDYDGQARNATTPDIGADEGTFTPLDLIPPSVVYTPLPNTSGLGARSLTYTITDPSGVGSGANKPVLFWKINAGAYSGPVSPTGTPPSYTYSFGSGVAAADVVSYFLVAQDVAGNVAAYPGAGSTVAANPPSYSVPPTSPNTYLILGTICGAKTVGVSVACDYPTLTAAIADLNTKQLTCAVTYTLMDAAYNTASGETFPLVINSNPGASATNTITFKPGAGVTTVISGSATSALIKILNNYTYIDGSNSGGTTRDLTITNTSATTPQVLVIGSTGTTPITNVTLKNTIIINGVNSSSAIVLADGAGTAGYFNNITFQNNSIKKAYIGVYCLATVAAGNGSGLLFTGNEFTGATTDAISGTSIYVQGVDGVTVTGNTISNGLNSAYTTNPNGIWFATGTKNGTISNNTISNLSYTGTSSYAPNGILVTSGVVAANVAITGNTISGLASSGTAWTSGIYVGGGGLIEGVTVLKNKITNIKNSNSGGYSANGIVLYSTSNTSNTLVANNFISDVAGYGYSSHATDNGFGIRIEAGGGYNIYYNSVNLATNQTSATGYPAALLIGSSVTTANSLDIRNNIFAISSTVGTDRYAIECNAANTVFSLIDYNDYYTTGTNLGYIASANVLDLAAWRVATGKDAKSVSGDPKYTSATDLHIITSAISPVSNAGVTVAVTDDIDGDVRTGTPDIGADEYIYAPPAVLDPTGVTATAISSSQIDVNFTPNSNNNNVVILWNLTGTFTTPIGAPPSVGVAFAGGTVLSNGVVHPVHHTGLTASTHYYYKAFSFDGLSYSPGMATDASTPCAAVTVLPYNEGFEVTWPPSCWANTGWVSSLYGGAHTGTKWAYSNLSGSILTTPGFTLSSNSHFRYWYRVESSSYPQNMDVKLSTDGINFTTTLVSYAAITNTTYAEAVIDLTAYTGQTVYIRFNGLSGTGGYDYGICVDDILMEVIPLCPYPSALTAVPGNFFANLGWTAGGTETSWDIEYGATPYTYTGTPTITGVTNPYTLTGLLALTGYTYKVRASCGSGNYSVWVGPMTFTTLAACPAPTTLAVTGILPTSAKLGWLETGTATQWDIEVQPVATTFTGTPTHSGVTDNPYLYTGLTAGTAYHFQVRAYCDATHSSVWAGNYSFTTACNALSTYPWTEGFEGLASVGSQLLPPCMSYENVVGTSGPTTSSTTGTYYGPHTGTNFIYTTYANTTWIYSPAMNLTSGVSYDFSFWMMNEVVTSPVDFLMDVAYGTTNTNAGMTNVLATGIVCNNSSYVKFTYTFIPAVTGTYYMGVKTTSATTTPWYVSFDDFRFEPTPACAMPLSVTATPLSTTTASVAWTGATTVQIDYGAVGHAAGTGTVTPSTSTNPYTISSGLVAATTYDVYVRKDCGAGSYSAWFGPVQFTTLCGTYSAPFNQSFPTTVIPNCWSMSGPQSWLFTNTWPAYGASGVADHTPSGTGSFAGVDGSGSAGLTGITLLSPFIDVSALTNGRVKFYMFNNNVSSTNVADEQQLSVDLWDGAAWHTGAFLWDYGMNAAGWQEQGFNLSPYTITGPIQLRFVVNKGTGSPFYDDIMIDDISVYSVLAHDASTVSIDMDALIGAGTVTPKATVKNEGTNTETFPVTMTIGAYTSTKTVTALAPGASLQVTFDPWTAAVGTYSVQVCTGLVGDLNATNNCISKTVTVEVLTKFYAYNDFTSQVGYFYKEHPNVWVPLAAATSDDFMSGGTWAEGKWYAAEYYDNTVTPPTGGGWYTIDENTGAMTRIAYTATNFDGITYDHTAGIMYGVTWDGSTNSLYTIVPTTGAITLKGTMAAGELLINLATDGSGFLYSMGITTNHLFKINATTLAVTDLGATGYTMGYAQDMEYDYTSNTMYAAAYNTTTSAGGLYTANLTTGAFTFIGNFAGNAELGGFAIPYYKTLNLTVFLESLYNPAPAAPGTMREAKDWTLATGYFSKWGAGIADQITVELRDTMPGHALVGGSPYTVNLHTDGTATVTGIPSSLKGYVIVVVKNRNSIDTWTAKSAGGLGGLKGIPFSDNVINYNFSDAKAKAFGSNQKDLGGGYFGIYGGNADASGGSLKVDGTDMSLIENGTTAQDKGYHNIDVTGNGKVDGSDMALIDNNSTALVKVIPIP